MVKTTKRAARAHFRSDRFLKAGLIALLALILCSAAIGAAGAEIPTTVTTVTSVDGLEAALTGNDDFNIKLDTLDVFQLTQECTITKNGKLDLNGKVIKAASNSMLFYVSSGASFELTDTSENTSHNFVMHPGAVWVLDDTKTKDCTLADIIADSSKIVDGKVVSIPGGVITGGSAAWNGGGVKVNGMFTMSGGSIAGNSTTGSIAGGGVYVDGTFMMSGGSITGNSVTHAYNGGGGVKVNGTFTMEGGSITGNSATNGNGGGVDVSSGGTFTMEGGSITGNSANDCGGVYVYDGTFNVSGAPVIKNNTLSDGTANNVRLKSSYVTITGALRYPAEIYINTPVGTVIPFAYGTAQGGSEYLITPYDAAYFHTDSGTLKANVVKATSIASPPFKTSLVWGAGAQNMNTTEIYSTVQDAVNEALDGDTIRIIATELIENITVNKVITLDLNGCVLIADDDTSVITITETGNLTLIDSNPTTLHTFTFVKDGAWTPDREPAAGAVPLAKFDRADAEAAPAGTYHVSVSGGVITGGSATEGGGVYVNGGGTFKMSSGSITGNSASTNGGGVYVLGTFKMSGGSIAGNSAGGGGGVFVDMNNLFEMSGGSITGNSASTNGGGVFVAYNTTTEKGGTFKMSGGSITENIAAEKGGGVYVGGGVFVQTGTFEMSGGSIAGNSASTNGGGVYVDRYGMFTMSGNASIVGNSTSIMGGGVHVEGKFVMSDGSVTGNHAPMGGGVSVGGIGRVSFVDSGSGDITMYGGSITGNSATLSGGGVFLIGGDFFMRGGSIAGNSAGKNGGGVYVGDKCVFEMSSGSIAGNSSIDNGGGVYVDGTFRMSGGSIAGNTPDDIIYPKTLSASSTGGFTSETPVKETPATESSKSQGASVWAVATLTPTPTPTPSVTPTAEPTPEVPTVKPTASPTEQAKSPMPFLGILAGLGAAACLLAARQQQSTERKKT